MLRLHSICAALVSLTVAGNATAQSTPSTTTSNFLVILRNIQIGTEQTAVQRVAGGWTITSSGRMGAPLELVIRSLEIRYDDDWKPLGLNLDATTRGQSAALRVTVSGTSATTRLSGGGQTSDATHTIDPTAVLLPTPFFAAYEALAVRVKTAAPGTMIQAYQGGPVPVTIRVGDSVVDQIQTVGRLISARRTHLTLTVPDQPPTEVDIWGDETGRLLRFSVPAQNLEFVRDDVAAVSTRHVVISRNGDQQIRIPANGFTLAGTLSTPAEPDNGRLPAIILVGGLGVTDREEAIAGIPLMGQLAGDLSDAGFLVLRYDRRGMGQSGGRAETAGLPDFAEDLRAAVKAMSDRKDVDGKRITVVGHGDGGSIALLAAQKDGRIANVVLMGTPGVLGSELFLAQQTHVLERSKLSDADKQEKIDLQKRIHEAVLTAKGWESIPADVRKQVDTVEFQSLLIHDPAKVVPKVQQPMLILQGSLDTEVDPTNADRLGTLARARKRSVRVTVTTMENLNHLLVPAKTGEVDEYPTLDEKRISRSVATAISQWLLSPPPPPAQ